MSNKWHESKVQVKITLPIVFPETEEPPPKIRQRFVQLNEKVKNKKLFYRNLNHRKGKRKRKKRKADR